MEKLNLPAPVKQAIERLSLPQCLLLQGILLDHSLKLIGLEQPKPAVIKPNESNI
jgi:hypothetical protein